MKKIMLLAIACMAGFSSYSQSFMHGAGVVLFVDHAKNTDANGIGGLTYSPRFNFVEQDEMSVSVGIPLSIGLSGSYSAHYGDYESESNSLNFMFNAPLIVNLNMGCGATKESERRFGYFVGAGFGYHYGSRNYQVLGDGNDRANEKFSTVGPVANAGVRFGVGSKARHNIEVKLSYMKGLNAGNPDIFSVGALFNF
ncbi:MAG: hypothetical protein J7623_16385 [Chitinophaga sp.]|uniref:hypothetical protein n=1 Tax=Chitinophaga sp. TaxID=1869181 RepID=UPI001B0F544A|nr:hypothetical protein [Chitinophaga sp.]MBO9730219.1 hypothetical protein [Chitinophaga sp.]